MQRNRLLIIDDDPLICRTLEHIAQKAGFEVMSTDSAFSFLSQLELFEPSLVIVDLLMPNLSGMELMLRLAEMKAQARVIISSGQERDFIEKEARIAKANGLHVLGILQKPFSAANLKYLLTLHTSQFEKASNTATPNEALSSSDWTPSLDDIIRVIENDEITLCFQPKLQCSNNKLIGFEALARWNSPERGQITPDLFVALVEKNHLYSTMMANVARKGIDWLEKLNRRSALKANEVPNAEFTPYSLAFNITMNALYDQHLAEQISAICTEFKVAPHLITFEISEPDSIKNLDEFLIALRRFKDAGFRLSLDDFGTGHMALREVAMAPFDELKIDKEFVGKCDESELARAIVLSCIDIAKNLKLSVTAEGVETTSTLEFVNAHGCFAIQGFLISKPLLAKQIDAWLQQHNTA